MKRFGTSIAVAALLAMGTPAAAANIGWVATLSQIVIGFDDVAVGGTSFEFDPFDDTGFTNNLGGGVVTLGDTAFPARSGSQVYVGTSLTGDVVDFVDYCWPAVGGYVTGSAPITLTLYSYDGVSGSEFVSSTSVAGGTANYFLTSGGEGTNGFITRWEFSSDQAFSLDDLTLGLVDTAPGVPEPATWAMLLAGFGAIGAALRRRRGLPA